MHKEAGTRRLADLVNKGEVFDGAYTHPKVLAAIYQIIGRDFKLSALNGRDAVPGQGNQQLHADWGPRLLNERCARKKRAEPSSSVKLFNALECPPDIAVAS